MATVTSFEGLQHPTKSELRQFAELFMPLFVASTDDAKRQAVAALSQCPSVPPAVALFIGSQPIGIAAPFLASSQVIDDDTLIAIARTQGAAHARAIVRRDRLSPKVIDALVGLRQAGHGRGTVSTDFVDLPAPLPVPATAQQPPAAAPAAEAAEADVEMSRQAREERLRDELKQIARHLSDDAGDRLGLRTVSDMQEALLVRFARERDPQNFATTLADALSASRWLAERILLDLSGQQLAITLTSLGLSLTDAVFVLECFYPHLTEKQDGVNRAWLVLAQIDPQECEHRVEAWRRADRYTYLSPEQARPITARPDKSFARQVPAARNMRTISRAR